ncbi:MAG: hypothetical protein ACRDTJ_00855, partial [Pseudonocardiaceae bacterium]
VEALVDEHLTDVEVEARLEQVRRDAARSTPTGAEVFRHRIERWRLRGRWVDVVKICCYTLGVGNLIFLVFAEPTTLTLSLSVMLAPFTLAMALKLMAFLARSTVGFALGDRRERVEMLISAIGGLQPPGAGEKYRDIMIAEIHDVPYGALRVIKTDLVKTAPRTVLNAWVNNLRRVPVNYHDAAVWEHRSEKPR